MAPTPDRWQKIEALYHAALERDPASRAPFLDGACGSDSALRKEIESLLAEATEGQGLLDQPAAALLAEFGTIELNSGTRLGPYQIEAVIGQGGMGKVYRARDTRLGRVVAIKTSSARFIQRFEREARAIAALNHPHICHLYHVGPDYLVMEYVEGTPLKGPFPMDAALQYAEQICDALDAAHRGGIVHRDLKPANILLAKHGIKLLDFGLAQMEAGSDDPTMTHLTQTGALMGTPAYMAPEQWEGKKADARSDIYSFGCVLFEMLTGKRAAADRVALTRPSAEIQPELHRILSKCLEHDPGLRYRHAAEIRTDLLRLKRDTESARVTAGLKPEPAARRKMMVSAAAAVIAVFATGYFYFARALHGAPKLTGKDTIVLADFTNTTGDPVFDDTLRQGLSVQLQQSPFLSVVSDQRVRRTLSLMGQPADARLTPEIAQQVCERTAGAAVLEGSVASLGSQYVVGLRAKNCATGDVLDQEQAQATRKEDVLSSLSQIASKFRSQVGESMSTVEKHSTPLAEATTSSLEALKAFSTAMKVLYSAGDAAALPFFRRAVEIDPKFAIAYAYLGRTYANIGENQHSAENTAEAYQLRDRASDAERFFITAGYDLLVTGDLEKAQQTFELWGQTYPRELSVPGLLSGQIYPVLGKHEKAVEEAKKAIAIDPNFIFPYANLATSYQFLDRPEEAKAAYRQAASRKIEFPDLLIQEFDSAFVRGDKGEMEGVKALILKKSLGEDALMYHDALVEAYVGHLQHARTTAGHAVDQAQQKSQPERAAEFECGATLWEAFFENAATVRRDVPKALHLSKGRDVEYGAALALALSGDSTGAQRLASDLEKRYPEDTSVRFSYMPVLRARLALNNGDPSRAVETLQVAAQYELGVPMSWFDASYGELYPIYVRGESYLAAHQGTEAAAEFQRIIDHPGLMGADPVGALAHWQLGRALALSGDKTKAKAAYRDFLNLWKDADPDIPILRQAKAEYARL